MSTCFHSRGRKGRSNFRGKTTKKAIDFCPFVEVLSEMLLLSKFSSHVHPHESSSYYITPFIVVIEEGKQARLYP